MTRTCEFVDRTLLCVLTLLLWTVVVLPAGCAHEPPTLSPAAHVAFAADQVVQRLAELENAAIAASTSQPPALPVATARLIVTFVVDALKTLQASPQGWQATVQAAWQAVRPQVATVPEARSYLIAVDSLLAAGGAQ